MTALLGSGVFLLHGFDGPLSRDASIYAYAGQQVAEGVPPYAQVLNRAGPLAHLVPGAGVVVGRALGVDDVLAMRATMAVLSAAALWAAYVLGRDLYASRFAGVVAGVSLLSFQGFVTYATEGPREKTTMVLFLLLALWAACRRRWGAAGAATALATLTWQGSFFPAAAVVLVAVLALPGWRARTVALARWAAVGLSLSALTVACFAAVGALTELWAGFYAVSARYADPKGLQTTLRREPERLVSGFGWSLPLLVAGVVAAVVLAGVRLRRLDRDSAAEVGTVGLGVGALVCLLWALVAFEGWPDTFLFLPFAACGLAGLAHLLVARTSRPLALRAGGLLTAVLLLATAVTAARDRSEALEEQRRRTAAALAALGDPSLVAVNNPTPLVLSRMRNPVRYLIFIGAQRDYVQATYPGGLEGMAGEIERRAPTVITVFHAPPGWLRPVLDRGYVRIPGTGLPFTWYVSVGDTTRAERSRMRRAAGSTPGPAAAPDVRRSLP